MNASLPLLLLLLIIVVQSTDGQNHRAVSSGQLDNNNNIVIPQQRRDRDIYVIGDLHGDVNCAKHWVERIGVVDNVDLPTKWLKPNASLVFMGDYVDKGPFSYQTLMLVKSLTENFPDHVTALMGNHEMELLKDRHEKCGMKYMYQISHVVHPSEYKNHIVQTRPWDQDDDLVVDLILNATFKVYSEKSETAPPVHFTPERLPESTGARNPRRRCVVDYVEDDNRKPLVKERLAEYQRVYLQAFASNTTLGRWMEETLKIVHIENGFLFVHGGMETQIAHQLSTDYASLNHFQQQVSANLRDDRFFPFIINSTTGRLVERLLYYRGNHEEDSCPELWRTLDVWGGVHVLAVGHTPRARVRTKCGHQFWALDALLGRWIRTSQGFHCPTEGQKKTARGAFTCPRLLQHCQGQIFMIQPDGNVKILEATV